MRRQVNKTTITFLGGVGTVTGSKILFQHNALTILIDCGLFQGKKEITQKNQDPFPMDPNDIDVIIITHAHLDHCGYLPALVKKGFSGPVYLTKPSIELVSVVLKDSAHIQEVEFGSSSTKKHKSKPFLYSMNDVESTIALFSGHEFHEWIVLSQGVRFQFLNSGHILGSAMVEFRFEDKNLLISGDIGRGNPQLMHEPEKKRHADYLILESTYGDRLHPSQNEMAEMSRIILETLQRKGILLIPSFAIERTQEIIFLLYKMKEENMIPSYPIYLDSPMAVAVTDVYNHFPRWHHIPSTEWRQMLYGIHMISDFQESTKIVSDNKPKIVIAGSGMLEGGRMLHYLLRHAGNPKNAILFVGFQAEETLGRALIEGAKEVEIMHRMVEFRCEIHQLTCLSAHADYSEILTWLKHFENPPIQTFLYHGENEARENQKIQIEKNLGWTVTCPESMSSFDL
jgi:metallo-beta-lactamase family protein